MNGILKGMNCKLEDRLIERIQSEEEEKHIKEDFYIRQQIKNLFYELNKREQTCVCVRMRARACLSMCVHNEVYPHSRQYL